MREVSQLDGCSSGKAGEIVAAAELGRAVCKDITCEQAARLLTAARGNTKQVTHDRLGAVGANFGNSYARADGVAKFGSAAPFAEVPFVVEAWAEEESEADETVLTVGVNRTTVTGDIEAAHDTSDTDAFGCGLSHAIAKAPKEKQFDIWINITTPYMPITSDGKAPNLRPFLTEISTAATKAVKKSYNPHVGGKKRSQKDIVLDNLDDAIASVSGDGEFEFGHRQLLYALRPIVMKEIGKELKTPNFNQIITDYENEHGDIPGAYHEPRGTIYHPHRNETLALSTLMVKNYERPTWTFNKLLYIEKEGFLEALKAVRWPERHDCAPMSSKGFTTRAVRDLVDKLAEHDEPVTVFCAHDAIVTFGSPQAASFNTTKSGGTVGGGVEKRLWGGWTAKAEYLYVNLGSFNHVIQTPTTAAGTFATFSSTTVFRITSSALG